jgi:hypothetical protein
VNFSTFRCSMGLHRWDFKDERRGDEIVTWAWCRNVRCPRWYKPTIVNVDFRPLPRDRHEA